jgi:hypothetical protein
MASPLDQLAAAIQEAITNALQAWNPNPDTVTGGSGGSSGGGGGGTSEDIVGLALGLVGIGLALNPEIDVVIEGLKGASEGLGGTGEQLAIAYFLAQVLLPIVEPYTRYVTHEVENAAQSQIFDPATAADLASRRIITPDFAASESGGSGFDSSHSASFLDAAYNRPSWDVALRLWNRGYIAEADVDTSLQYGGVPEYWWPFLKALQRELLTPADLALAVLRGTITNDQGVAGAAQFGLNADDFATLLDNTGEPLAMQELNMALRRGFIDDATYTRGILQSRVRDEWIPTALALRYFPMSVAQAANGVTRGYITEAQGAAIALQNGLEASDWPTVLASNGRPLSHEQMAQLYYRGLVTKDEWQDAIRQSDVKDEYIDDAVELGVKLLPFFEAVTLLKNGDISAKTFTTEMLDQGYQQDVLTEITTALAGTVGGVKKHLTVADLQTMFEEGVLSHDLAVTDITTLGYSKDDAEALLNLAATRRANELTRSQITTVKGQYNKYKIDDVKAIADLESIGVSKADAAQLVDEWATVRPDGTRELTEAQVMRLLKESAINRADAVQRLQAIGFTAGDANLLITSYAPNAT